MRTSASKTRATGKRYQCPTCHTLLSRKRYEEALGIQRQKEQELAQFRAAIEAETARYLAAAKADREKAARELKSAKSKDQRIQVLSRRLKTARADATAQFSDTIENQAAQIDNLTRALEAVRRENRHLKRGTNQATDGRAWEGRMCDFIAAEFRPLGDLVTPTERSRNGDALWQIRDKQKVHVGPPIIIEFKTSRIVTAAQVKQTRDAKEHWKANIGLLVSSGHCAGFDGVKNLGGNVLLVKPKSLLTILHFIREQHLDLARMAASHGNDALANIMACLKGDDFMRPVKDALRIVDELEENLKRDATRFETSVECRRQRYARVRAAAETIRDTTDDILRRYADVQARKVVPIRRARSA